MNQTGKSAFERLFIITARTMIAQPDGKNKGLSSKSREKTSKAADLQTIGRFERIEFWMLYSSSLSTDINAS